MSLLVVVGSFRIVSKPLMLFLQTVADRNNWAMLEKFLEFVESNKIFRAIFFLLDYVSSKNSQSQRKRRWINLNINWLEPGSFPPLLEVDRRFSYD